MCRYLILSIFLAITCLQNSVWGIFGEESGGYKCSPHLYSWGTNIFYSRCCNGDYFNYHHLKTHMDECTVPPKDSSLSISDSTWILFECLMSKSLSSKSYSLSNFAQTMTANMSESLKSKIMAKLTQKIGPISPDQSEKDKLILIQEMWTKYFDAEYQVCYGETEEGKGSTGSKYWSPSTSCRNSSYPNFSTIRRSVEYNKTLACQEALLAKHNFKNYTSQEKSSLRSACKLMELDIVKESDLYKEDTFDVKKVAKAMMPQFWSESVKDKAMKFMFRSFFFFRPANATLDFEQNILTMKENAQTQVWSYNGGNHAETEDFFIHVNMLKDLDFNAIFLRYYVCRHMDYDFL